MSTICIDVMTNQRLSVVVLFRPHASLMTVQRTIQQGGHQKHNLMIDKIKIAKERVTVNTEIGLNLVLIVSDCRNDNPKTKHARFKLLRYESSISPLAMHSNTLHSMPCYLHCSEFDVNFLEMTASTGFSAS